MLKCDCGREVPECTTYLCVCGIIHGKAIKVDKSQTIEMTLEDMSVKTIPSYYARKEVCNGCKYRIPKGCALYIKPCTVKRLWHDQITPPESCPQKAKFDE